jgi:hypothetical protein
MNGWQQATSATLLLATYKHQRKVKWFRQAWDSVPADVITHSFKVCGISLKLDGSEDSEIHVLKQDGVAYHRQQMRYLS